MSSLSTPIISYCLQLVKPGACCLAKYSILLSEAQRQLFKGRPGPNLYLTPDPLDDASDYTISKPADQGSRARSCIAIKPERTTGGLTL